MRKTVKARSVLHSYPTEGLKEAITAIEQIIANEGVLTIKAVAAMQPLRKDIYAFRARSSFSIPPFC